MKKVLAVIAFCGVVPLVQADNYTPDFVASVFENRDIKIDGTSKPERSGQLKTMATRAASQCRNNLQPGKEAENIGNMVMHTQKALAKEGVHVSHYELLDVLYGLLGDGASNWDCASALAMYLTVRTGEPAPAETHIAAYKMLQAFRDNGILGH